MTKQTLPTSFLGIPVENTEQLENSLKTRILPIRNLFPPNQSQGKPRGSCNLQTSSDLFLQHSADPLDAELLVLISFGEIFRYTDLFRALELSLLLQRGGNQSVSISIASYRNKCQMAQRLG